jgi:hypothetical protein
LATLRIKQLGADNMIPERSLKAKTAKSVFFEEINDIDIFIEDTAFGYEKLFQLLFSRVFDGKYQVNKVFPLGGRKAVTDQHKLHEKLGRPSLFIVDGDLFLLTGDEVNNEEGLYKVPFYCIENILCDSDALHDLMNEEEPENLKPQIIQNFNYLEWKALNEDKLFDLFVEYGITFLLNPMEQTVAFSVSNLVSSNTGDINEAKLTARIDSLRELAKSMTSEESYNETKNRILTQFQISNIPKLDVVSGKDYLFPLLKTRAKSIVKTKIPDINLKIRLAMKCDITSLMGSHELVAC